MVTKKSKSVAPKKSDYRGEVQPDQKTEQIGVVTPRFRLVFFTVLGCTSGLLLVDLTLALALSHPSAAAQSLMDLCSRLVAIGFGAIIGLLGGKAT